MKLFIILAVYALAQGAKLDRTYLPPDAESSAGSDLLETPRESGRFPDYTSAFSNNEFSSQNVYAQNEAYSGFEARPERAQAAFERNAAILRQDNSNDGETYAYAYETENGIYGEENGVATNGVQAQGGYSYTGDDGKVYSVRYTADENGFQPQGDHLPTPPPVPAEILKALEQNARDEAAGIFDDGSYNEVKYDSTIQQQYYNTVKSNNADPFINNNAFSRNDAAESGSFGAEVLAQRNNQESEVGQVAFNNNAFVSNNAAGRARTIYGDQRAYIPPFAERNNQRSDVTQATFNNDALIRHDVAGSGNSIARVQNAYLPPFAQRNNQEIEVSQANFNNNAFVSNNAVGAASAIDRGQRAYLPPFAQRNNQESEVSQAIFNNNAFDGNSGAGSVRSVPGEQDAYLPPFSHGNTQRSRVSQSPFNNNAIAGIQKTYLPPFAQSNYQDSLVTQATFNNNGLVSHDATPGSSSAVGGFQRAYLPPGVQQDETAGSRSSIAGVTNAYLPPLTQLHNRDAEEKSTVDKRPLSHKGYLYAKPSLAFPVSAIRHLKKNYSKKLVH